MKIAEYKKVDGVMQLVTRDATAQEEAEISARSSVDAEAPTEIDRIEAQVLYTALMTDTLIEEE